MATKKTTAEKTSDAIGVEVRIHGVLIQNVHSVDIAKGEVWCHDGVDPTKPVELKTGTVTVSGNAPAA